MPKRTKSQMEQAILFALLFGKRFPGTQPKDLLRVMEYARQLAAAYGRDSKDGLNYEQARRVRIKRDKVEKFVGDKWGLLLNHTPQIGGEPFELYFEGDPEYVVPVPAI
tara:strand:+ start:367 stop:693 length:327 start_codon:yes stop_codon:yes gene_type:complete